MFESRMMLQPIIYSDGSVSWMFPGYVEAFCHLDMSYFPWDQQVCPLKFGSWGFDGGLLDIVNKSTSGDLSFFSSNGEWDVLSMPVRRHEIYYVCCPNPYVDVTFYVVLQRKPLFYLFNLVLPSILITVVSILAFLLPNDSGEKMSLSVTILLAMTVFLSYVSSFLPSKSDSLPLIGKYM